MFDGIGALRVSATNVSDRFQYPARKCLTPPPPPSSSYFNDNQYPDEAKREEIANACNAVIQKPGKTTRFQFLLPVRVRQVHPLLPFVRINRKRCFGYQPFVMSQRSLVSLRGL